MKLVMVGAGYVGLTTGACLADLGHVVTCVDIDKGRIDALRHGESPIFEPGLSELIERAIRSGRLHFTDQLAIPAAKADIVMLAVGTPSMPDGSIDLSYVEGAASQAARVIRLGAALVVKSTVVPGTARRLTESITAKVKRRIAIASNPEFLREGSAIADFCGADRVVIGCDEPRTQALLEQLYRPLTMKGVPLIATDTVSAEMIKYAANSFLALKIGFINEVADLCAAVGGDITAVAEGVGLDRRIGTSFLSPGPGFGGSCFPKDTRALVMAGRASHAPQELVEKVVMSNARRKRRVAREILQHLGPRPQGKTVALLGSAFKANTDDVRESAATTVVPLLVERGVIVRIHDPQPPLHLPSEFAEAKWCETPLEAARGAHAVVILTEWDAYRELDLAALAAQCKQPLLIDYRNIVDGEAASAAGFEYFSVGRRPVHARTSVVAGGRATITAVAAPST